MANTLGGQKFVDKLKAEFPGLWAAMNETQRDRIKREAQTWTSDRYEGFRAAVLAFPGVAKWQADQAAATTPPLDTDGDGIPDDQDPTPTGDEMVDMPDDDPFAAADAAQAAANEKDVREGLRLFLEQNELPATLMGFINEALSQKMPFSEIVSKLRQTPEYKAAYPENDLRQANGFDWQPESWIRGQRAEMRRIAREYQNVDLTDQDIATFIGHDRSVSEFENTMVTWKNFEKWGPLAHFALEQELGYSVSDDRVYALLSDEMATPDLDRAMARALTRSQPALLGLGLRPEEEAKILEQYGISPEKAFQGYQGIVSETPRAERYAMIENHIGENAQSFPSGSDLFQDTPFALLFRGIQLGDESAMSQLRQQLARETARFQAGGGAISSGGAASGLLTEAERALR